MTKVKKQTATKSIKVKAETYEALGKLATGFESVDDVIRRLIEFFQGKGKK